MCGGGGGRGMWGGGKNISRLFDFTNIYCVSLQFGTVSLVA